MKNSFMRITALVLAMLVCLSGVACGDSQPTDKDTDTVTQDTTPEETTSKWLDSLPDKDMNGTEINILTAAEQWSYFYDTEDDGDIVNDSVYARNKTVEERFNCKLNYRIYNGYMGGMSDVKSALTGSVMGGTKDFDLMVGSVSYVYPLIADNLFSDLKSCDQLSFDSQWWFNKINDEFEINGRLFLGASAYGILNTAWSVVTYFNKNVAEDFEIEDLYKLVLDGKWTFDKMNELAQKVTHDANGDNVIDDQDVVGIASTDDYIPWLSTSMGYKFTYKEDGKIKLNGLCSEFSVNARKSDLVRPVRTGTGRIFSLFQYRYQSSIKPVPVLLLSERHPPASAAKESPSSGSSAVNPSRSSRGCRFCDSPYLQYF